jgi:sec-independent protein translocase protein TatA
MLMPLAFGFPGPEESILIAIIALLLFGKRLPEVGRSLGKGIIEFKKGLAGIEEDVNQAANAQAKPPQAELPKSQAPQQALPAQAPDAEPYRFDPHTGKPIQFDPYTGKPLTDTVSSAGPTDNVGAGNG